MDMESDDSRLTDREIDRMVNGYQDHKKDGIGACPSEEDLFHYIQGNLPQERINVVQGHLSLCPLCQDIVCSFKQFGLDVETSSLTGEEFIRQAEALDIPDAQASPPTWEQVKKKLPSDLKSQPKSRWKRFNEWLFSGRY